VTWSAVFAGAAVAAAVSLILVVLGSALGLSSISPWEGQGASAAAFGVGAAIWLVVTQWIASGLGGYLTGRLRVRWVGVHTHEVFFRDTAHGFLAWAVATLTGVAMLAIAGSLAAGLGVHATATVAGGAAQGVAQRGDVRGMTPGLGTPSGYFTDMLFRMDNPPAANAAAPAANPGAPAATPAARDPRAEASLILLRSVGGDMSADDKAYLARLVAAQTGMSPDDAAKRVDAVNAQVKAASDKVKAAADKARKTAATASLFAFLSLLIGAFIASVAAAFGGSQRDEYETIYLQAR
jgi:hypothetical protein